MEVGDGITTINLKLIASAVTLTLQSFPDQTARLSRKISRGGRRSFVRGVACACVGRGEPRTNAQDAAPRWRLVCVCVCACACA
jgi:hypothetical protein